MSSRPEGSAATLRDVTLTRTEARRVVWIMEWIDKLAESEGWAPLTAPERRILAKLKEAAS